MPLKTERIHVSKFELALRKEREVKPVKHHRHIEDSIQIRCRREFDRIFPQYSILLNHFKNEQKGDKERIKNFQMGVRSGAADFVFLHPNGKYPFIALELKAPKGKQSENQKIFQKAVEEAGGKYVICRSVAEFMKEITIYISMI